MDTVLALCNSLYTFSIIGLSLFGLHSLVLTFLFLFNRPPKADPPSPPPEWPLVTVQLPLYNERYVAERLIDTI